MAWLSLRHLLDHLLKNDDFSKDLWGIYRHYFRGQKQVVSRLFFTGWCAFFCSISNPWRSHSTCWYVISRTSSGVLGHWNFIPSSRFLAARTKPFRSYRRTFIASFFLLQKIKTWLSWNGSRWNWRLTQSTGTDFSQRIMTCCEL